MEFLNIGLILDVLIILIPVAIAIFLLFKFVVPKRPALGIGLAVGGGLIGAWLIGRRIKGALDVERKLAEHNEMMAKFKSKQKNRFEAVMANKKMIDELEKQRDKLAAQGDKYKTEVELLNKEIEDRHKMNKTVLENTDEFVSSLENRRKSIGSLLDRFEAEKTATPSHEPQPVIPNLGTADQPKIEVNGFSLQEG
jgi:hypothetical protein